MGRTFVGRTAHLSRAAACLFVIGLSVVAPLFGTDRDEDSAEGNAPLLTSLKISPVKPPSSSTVAVTVTFGYKDGNADLKGGQLSLQFSDCKGVLKTILFKLSASKYDLPQGTDKRLIQIKTRDCSWMKVKAQLKDAAGLNGPAKWLNVALQSSTGTTLGKKAVNFTLHDQSGNSVSLYDYLGKVVLLDLSAMWCGPCQSEADDAEELYQKYKSRGFVILSVLIEDYSGALPDQADAQSWAQTYALTIPVLTDSTNDVWDLYNDEGYIPLNLIMDRGLIIKYKDVGYGGDTLFESIIEPLL